MVRALSGTSGVKVKVRRSEDQRHFPPTADPVSDPSWTTMYFSISRPIGREKFIAIDMVIDTPVTPFAGETDCSAARPVSSGPPRIASPEQAASVASAPDAMRTDRAVRVQFRIGTSSERP